MIDQNILFIILSIMFVLVLFLIAVIHSKVHWIIKSFLIIFSLFVTAMNYQIIIDSLGWPVTDKIPKQFKLLAAVIDEPTDVYIWYQNFNTIKPKSIRIPYSKDLHKKMAKAQAMLAQGETVYMGTEDMQEGAGNNKTGKKGNNIGKDGKRNGNSNIESNAELDFIEPPSTTPEKNIQ